MVAPNLPDVGDVDIARFADVPAGADMRAVALLASDWYLASDDPPHQKRFGATVLVHQILGGGLQSDLTFSGHGADGLDGFLRPPEGADAFTSELHGALVDLFADR